jgi:prepilin-type processing-associated H-X9-DG protein
MPYNSSGGRSQYAADGTRSAAFAVMADKNPYLDPKIGEIGVGTSQTWENVVGRMDPYYINNATVNESAWQVQRANAQPHDREGQNVLYADGHTAYEQTTDVGVKNDAIYLPIGGADDSASSGQGPVRMGYYGALGSAPVHNLAIQVTGTTTNLDDSFLINDDVHDPTQHP